MKGIILNLVEEAVVAAYGDEAWDTLLERGGLDGVYTSLGDYPEEHLHLILDEGAAMLGTTPTELARALGHDAVLGLARRYPAYFSAHEDTRSFLPTLSAVIHPEVRKLYPASDPPDFWFEDGPDGALRAHYRSHRRLCALAEGMIAGAATQFGERADLDQVECSQRGADHCVIDVRFEEP